MKNAFKGFWILGFTAFIIFDFVVVAALIFTVAHFVMKYW